MSAGDLGQRRPDITEQTHPDIEKGDKTPSVPRFGLYLLFYLPKKMRGPLIGDLEEEFKQICCVCGQRWANIWYYTQIFLSFWPFLVRFGKGIVKAGIVPLLIRLGVPQWGFAFLHKIIH